LLSTFFSRYPEFLVIRAPFFHQPGSRSLARRPPARAAAALSDFNTGNWLRAGKRVIRIGVVAATTATAAPAKAGVLALPSTSCVCLE